jgi:hypothetical protein
MPPGSLLRVWEPRFPFPPLLKSPHCGNLENLRFFVRGLQAFSKGSALPNLPAPACFAPTMPHHPVRPHVPCCSRMVFALWHSLQRVL